jgi:hypothetical protein
MKTINWPLAIAFTMTVQPRRDRLRHHSQCSPCYVEKLSYAHANSWWRRHAAG